MGDRMNSKLFVYCAAAWIVPGLGHLLLKRRGRGILIFGVVVSMLIIGWLLKGTFLFQTGAEQGMMHIFHLLSTLGNGAFFLFQYLLGGSAILQQIQDALKTPTFEYGVRFLAAAGLLNYLSILDVADIALGRKE
jgi:TM2 domain-containing membrane protein YozV